MSRLGRYLFALSLFALADSALAEVFCVDTAEEIQDALTSAASNGQDDEVQIVQGSYIGNFVYDTSVDSKSLGLSGGFTKDCVSLDINPANTILEGDQNKNKAVMFLIVRGLSTNLTVKGITLRNGKSSGAGGGLSVHVGAGSTLSIEDNSIEGNSILSEYGGGVYIGTTASTIYLINNRISSNAAFTPYFSAGGGVYVANNSGFVVLTGNIIEGNTTSSASDSSCGGGVYIHASPGTVDFTNNRIISNSASTQSVITSYFSSGGGLCVITSSGTVHFADNTIEGNQGSLGGGVRVYAGNLSNVSFANNIIANNAAMPINSNDSNGGGVYYLAVSSGTVNFTNNTIHGNEALRGGGLSLDLGVNELNSSLALFNNLFWNNSADSGGSDIWVNNDRGANNVPTPISLFANSFDQTSGTGYFVALPIPVDTTNLNKVDPLFVDTANGDYHLQPDSPMIDAGYLDTPDLPEFDIEGAPRVLGALVDIGAYEYQVILSVMKDGTGSGTITSDPTGISCGTYCDYPFAAGTDVSLFVTASANSIFDGWSGDEDCGNDVLTMDGYKQCTATFSAARQLTLSKSGNGDGTITSSPAGINCGASCTALFYLNEAVTLAATSATGSSFTGWSGGGCTGTSTCIVNLDESKEVTATFALKSYKVTAIAGRNGAISPASTNVEYGGKTSFTLTPNAGFQIGTVTGCNGNLSGNTFTTGPITEACTVSATFSALPKYALKVTKSGTGTVTSSPIGINCGRTCSYSFTSGTNVSLTATPGTGYLFSGWTGCTTMSGNSCAVSMSGAKSVKATFIPIPKYALSITKSGTGIVTSTPTGINCGRTCSYSFTSGTDVTLTAKAGSGYQFTGWTGACTNTSGTCTVSMTAAKSVTATFKPLYKLSLRKSGYQYGSVTSSPTDINCGISCSSANTTFVKGTAVVLTATPISGRSFKKWAGACTGTAPTCTLPMNSAKSVTAVFQ